MTVYADTSALAKLLIVEPGSVEMVSMARSDDVLATASIAYVELRAALAAARRDGRVPGTAGEDFARVEALWREVSEVVIDAGLVRVAGDLAERMRLRAYDAVHLAALVVLGAPDEVTFACWDTELRRAAAELGFALFPR